MPLATTENFESFVGQETGTSDWVNLSQDRINKFADVTEDHQFIHIDPEAAAKTPFGGTIAHGFLTLSMLSKMAEGCALGVEGMTHGVNYGFEKVRFINPVHAGKNIRGKFVVKEARQTKPGQYVFTYEITVEIEGNERPALICDWVSMIFVPPSA